MSNFVIYQVRLTLVTMLLCSSRPRQGTKGKLSEVCWRKFDPLNVSSTNTRYHFLDSLSRKMAYRRTLPKFTQFTTWVSRHQCQKFEAFSAWQRTVQNLFCHSAISRIPFENWRIRTLHFCGLSSIRHRSKISEKCWLARLRWLILTQTRRLS